MHKYLLATVAALTLAGAAGAEQIKVGIAAEAYPPFASQDASGAWVGWEVEMIGPLSGLPNYLGNRVRVARRQPSGPLGPLTRPLSNPLKNCSGAKNLSGTVAVSLNLGD